MNINHINEKYSKVYNEYESVFNCLQKAKLMLSESKSELDKIFISEDINKLELLCRELASKISTYGAMRKYV